jgi:hypothetical protein
MDRRPANDDMCHGYMDGRDMDSPEPSANRSHSYRHGFRVGRAEKCNERLGTFQEVTALADAAMEADDGLAMLSH